MRPPELGPPRVALVIGAGALKCAAAYGVARVLQEHQVPIARIVGCSGGAFCAAWLAAGGGDPQAVAERFARGWEGAFDEVDYRAVLGAVFPRWLGFSAARGIVRDRAINAAIEAEFGERRFEDLATPLQLVATDFESGEQIVISSGRLFDAIRASIALPLILPPWPRDGRLLVDGAVCDPLPVDVALREGADIIVAVGFESPLEPGFHSGMGLTRQLTALMVNHLLRAQYAFFNLAHHAETILVMPEFDRPVGLNDVHLVPWLVEQGALAAEREMPYLRRLLEAGRLQPT
jgi:NTE family protein